MVARENCCIKTTPHLPDHITQMAYPLPPPLHPNEDKERKGNIVGSDVLNGSLYINTAAKFFGC